MVWIVAATILIGLLAAVLLTQRRARHKTAPAVPQKTEAPVNTIATLEMPVTIVQERSSAVVSPTRTAEVECAALLATAAKSRLQNDPREAANTLRQVVELATAYRLETAHAEARLELGDLSASEGDLTTACEHWQMARHAFHESRDKVKLAATEERMRKNGCPSDWVLNDF